MGEAIVQLEDVWVSLDGVTVLEGVSLTLHEREFVALIGPNGGGKTTLLRVILGLVKPYRGSVQVFGQSPEEGRRWIGYLPQYAAFDREFPITVLEVVLMGRYRGPFKAYTEEDVEAAMRALETVGMAEHIHRRIGHLSGGELQRVLMARALAREPRLLLLDEPMSNIDPEMRESLYQLLVKLKERMAILLVSHDIAAVSTYVEKVACLNRRLSYYGSREEVLRGLGEAYRHEIELLERGYPWRCRR
ncbi:MAG TPA: ABC transporter ATP-binding protein [Candidatus Bathyarchaeota archaeon]|nr:ABC transporter ATP-binding protein [Candidatus Bathyarchaeota archaeon]